MIDGFTEDALVGCLKILDTLPDTVFRVCDLLLAVFARNGDAFKERVLRKLIEEVKGQSHMHSFTVFLFCGLN